jgi:hypothetical protein
MLAQYFKESFAYNVTLVERRLWDLSAPKIQTTSSWDRKTLALRPELVPVTKAAVKARPNKKQSDKARMAKKREDKKKAGVPDSSSLIELVVSDSEGDTKPPLKAGASAKSRSKELDNEEYYEDDYGISYGEGSQASSVELGVVETKREAAIERANNATLNVLKRF